MTYYYIDLVDEKPKEGRKEAKAQGGKRQDYRNTKRKCGEENKTTDSDPLTTTPENNTSSSKPTSMTAQYHHYVQFSGEKHSFKDSNSLKRRVECG